MFEPTPNTRTLQRGIDEALACRDLLTTAPVKPSRLARFFARLGGPGRWFARRLPTPAPRAAPPVAIGARGR